MRLEVQDLHGGYGQTTVVRGITFTLDTHERLGLFGPNGNGKSTLLSLIAGLIHPTRGQIYLDGQAIAGLSPPKVVERGLVLVPQGNLLFPRMTVLENLMLGAYTGRCWPRRSELADQALELFPPLAQRRRQLARTLSGGERQMLALGVGLMADPQVLLLDEPTLGLAPKVKEHLSDAISTIARTGVAMVVVDQDVEFLLALTQRLLFVEQGEVRATIDDASQLADSDIAHMYFGGRVA